MCERVDAAVVNSRAYTGADSVLPWGPLHPWPPDALGCCLKNNLKL